MSVMSVLIKGVEMPTGNDELRLIIRSNGQVIISHKTHYEETEVVPVPPHGRLIDADALKSVLKWHHSIFIGAEDEVEKAQSDALICAISEVVNAPTIISAEEGET